MPSARRIERFAERADENRGGIIPSNAGKRSSVLNGLQAVGNLVSQPPSRPARGSVR